MKQINFLSGGAMDKTYFDKLSQVQWWDVVTFINRELYLLMNDNMKMWKYYRTGIPSDKNKINII